MSFRYAICNETYQTGRIERVVRPSRPRLHRPGAAHSPRPLITDVSAAMRRSALKRVLRLTIIGLHWLLAKTEG